MALFSCYWQMLILNEPQNVKRMCKTQYLGEWKKNLHKKWTTLYYSADHILFCRVPYTEKAHGSSFFLWKSRWFHKKIITLKSHWNYSWDLSDKIKFSFRFIFQRLNKVYSFAKSIEEWPSAYMLTIFWNDIAEWVATIIFNPKWN